MWTLKSIIFGGLVLIGGLDLGMSLVYIVLPLDGQERQAVGLSLHRTGNGGAGSVWGSSVHSIREFSHQMIADRMPRKVRKRNGSTVTQ